MADTSFDVIIIGSGPGGYVTAIRAAQLGFKTAIVEKSYLGGICLNWGCIPTKALLRSAEIYHYMQHAKDYGLSAEKVSFDPKAVVQRSRGVSKRLNDGVGFLMKKNKVTVIWGEASIDAPGKVTVKKSAVEAPKGALGEGSLSGQAHHRRDRRAAARAAGAGARQEAGLDLFRGDGAGARCRNRCWWSARARSASSSRRSSAPWAPTSPWSKCCRRFCRWRTPRSQALRASGSRSRASRFSPTPR